MELPENKHQHLLKDEMIIELTNAKTKEKYPKKLRRDEESQQTVKVITDQTTWTAKTITELYKAKWQTYRGFFFEKYLKTSS